MNTGSVVYGCKRPMRGLHLQNPSALLVLFGNFDFKCTFQNPSTIPSGRKVTQGERREIREKTPFIQDTTFLPATPTGSARTPLGSIVVE